MGKWMNSPPSACVHVWAEEEKEKAEEEEEEGVGSGGGVDIMLFLLPLLPFFSFPSFFFAHEKKSGVGGEEEGERKTKGGPN